MKRVPLTIRAARAILALLVVPMLLPTPARAGGEIYGSIYTQDGRNFTGTIRWDRSEAFWNDILDATKVERVPGVPQGEGLDPSLFDLENSRPASSREGHNALSVPFGHVRSLERADGGRVLLELKNGSRMEVIGSGDLGMAMRGLEIDDESQGTVRLDWKDLESAQFLPSPLDGRDPQRLYGSVHTAAGEFTGYLVWAGDGCLLGDLCRLTEPVRFSEVASIEKLDTGEARLRLKDGRTRNAPHATARTAALEISISGLGRVAVAWDQLQDVTFAPCPPSPVYGTFDGGRRLYGTVRTMEGRQHTGEIVWDGDERQSWEALDGEYRGVDFSILFDNIARIERRTLDYARVVLRDGRSFDLSGSSDVNRYNRGIRVRSAGGDEVELPWESVASAEFLSS